MNYSIISIGDTRQDALTKINEKMKNHNRITNIDYVDGRIHNAYDILNHFGVRLDKYAPDDGRTIGMTETEAGCWVSHIRSISAVVEQNMQTMLVFEDDVILHDEFETHLLECINDLPGDFDFLSLYSEPTQNVLTENSITGSNNIHKCISQLAYNQAMLYSFAGARKILKIARRMGATYNIDSIIYRASRDGHLNGYIIRPDRQQIVWHGSYQSIIDPTNFRLT